MHGELWCQCSSALWSRLPGRYGHQVSKTVRFAQSISLWLGSSFSIANQIKFDLQFTDLRSTWCSKLIIDQLCFVFPYFFDLQLRDPRFVDSPSTDPTLCRSDWLTVNSICSVMLNYPACTASGHAIASKRQHSNNINDIVCCQKHILLQINTGASIHFISSQNYAKIVHICDYKLRWYCRYVKPNFVRYKTPYALVLFAEFCAVCLIMWKVASYVHT